MRCREKQVSTIEAWETEGGAIAPQRHIDIELTSHVADERKSQHHASRAS